MASSVGMVGNAAFFSLRSCPFLASHLTLAIPIIAAVLFFFVISCLLQTSFRDPGILPRATPSEAADLEKRIGELLLPLLPLLGLTPLSVRVSGSASLLSAEEQRWFSFLFSPIASRGEAPHRFGCL